VTAVSETLGKTTLGNWAVGHTVNLERSLSLNGRLDGHIVQGHVDTTGTCREKKVLEGSWVFGFSFPREHAALVIEKGSISLNGISLTVFDVTLDSFSVAIIPYTYEHTNLNRLVTGMKVNLEFDLLGKYVLRNFSARLT
jgi:riboflavin synthase